MMNVKVYNSEGKEAGTMELSEKIFGVELNSDLVHQVMVSQMGNRRQVLAHTKGRGEVSGGGKKPWAQKHTGRARHGSIRSPIWVGGGVTFGPTNQRVYDKKINARMRRKALFMVLSEKVRMNLVVLLEDLKLGDAKTKALKTLLGALPCDNQNTLLCIYMIKFLEVEPAFVQYLFVFFLHGAQTLSSGKTLPIYVPPCPLLPALL